jgi:cell division septation protein DedD
MATEHILSLLIAERDKLSKAIEALGGAPKAVASPKVVDAPAAAHVSAAAPAPAKRRARKPLTATQKKAHSERMKAFWEARRKKQPKG